MFRGLMFRRIAASALLPAAIFSVLWATRVYSAPLPTALAFIGYGQSTMAAPGTNAYQGATCTFATTAGGQITISGVTGTPFAAAVPGAVISAAGIAPGSNPTITAFVSGTSGGSGVYSVNVSISLGPVSCTVTNETTFMQSITGANVNSNAFMIQATPSGAGSPLLGPRGLWETLNGTNCTNSNPVAIGQWSGFTPLKEIAYATSCGNGGFYIESPLSSFVAQFIAQTGWSAPNAILAENMAHGGQDWLASYPNILAPGGRNDWANLVSAQKFIKASVQSATTLAGSFTGGPWNYRLGGIPLRLGESAAAGATATVGATPPSTASTSFLVTTSPQILNGVSQPVAGWCVYDSTASVFLGYATSWSSTTITLQANSLANGVAGDTIYLSPCYPGYLAELRSMVAQFTASDISDAPNPAGVPIFAAAPSSSNFGSVQKYYQFSINAAMTAEGFADRRFVVTGPSFVGTYQSDAVHQEPQGNAIVGAYMGKWAAWDLSGRRTPPFAMIKAERLLPSQMDGTHYGIRVTFQMPPSQPLGGATAAQEQTLQFYTDANLPNWTTGNYGFCYTDGVYPAGGSTLFSYCGTSTSGIAIASLPILASANSFSPGAANQIDIPLTGDPATATNATVSLGASQTPNGVTIWGAPNVHLFYHQVANKDCTKVANPGLSGKAYANTICDGGTGGNNYLIDFAAPSFIALGQTIQPAW